MQNARTLPILAVPLSLLPLALLGCGEANQYQPPPPPTVTVAKPLVKTVTNYLEETGTTEAVQRVEIRARVKGFLETIEFEPGAEVAVGDSLYRIEETEYQARVDAAKADLRAANVALTRAQIEVDRQQNLIAENATAQATVDTADAERDGAVAAEAAAQANLNKAELDLSYTEVRSPIEGRVGKTFVKMGNLVGDGTATHLTTVIAYKPIYANFSINERAYLTLFKDSPGRTASDVDKAAIPFFLARAGDKGFPFEGHFDYADLAVDQSTGTYAVRGIFPNVDQRIVPGLFVRVRIPIGTQEDALLVPELALGADQAGRYLLVVDSENNVERRNVTVGIKHENMVVIDAGLQSDDWVVIQGVQRARPGAPVQPKQTELALGESEIVTAESDDGQPIEEMADDNAEFDDAELENAQTSPDDSTAPPESP